MYIDDAARIVKMIHVERDPPLIQPFPPRPVSKDTPFRTPTRVRALHDMLDTEAGVENLINILERDHAVEDDDDVIGWTPEARMDMWLLS